jgi:methylated-DNA-[protein]-cysteine S-methyltransferase
MAVIYHSTPIGFARIEDDDANIICSVTVHETAGEDATQPSPIILNVSRQLDEYFAGERRIFDFPFRQKGSDFQQSVWEHLCHIPYGKTVSYAHLSKKMNNPLAIRAIASANGKNNLWIIVPCHRVIGSDGSLTGYAGGLWRKKWLLDHETRVTGVGQASLF